MRCPEKMKKLLIQHSTQSFGTEKIPIKWWFYHSETTFFNKLSHESLLLIYILWEVKELAMDEVQGSEVKKMSWSFGPVVWVLSHIHEGLASYAPVLFLWVSKTQPHCRNTLVDFIKTDCLACPNACTLRVSLENAWSLNLVFHYVFGKSNKDTWK